MDFERPHAGRKQAEADRAAAVAVVDAVDERREFLALVVVGREEVRLMLAQREPGQRAQRRSLSGLYRGTGAKLLECASRNGVAGFLKGDSSQQLPRSATQERLSRRRRQK